MAHTRRTEIVITANRLLMPRQKQKVPSPTLLNLKEVFYVLSFSPFPTITTARLILRQLTSSDADDLFIMRCDPRMHEHTDTKPDATIIQTRVYMDQMAAGLLTNRWIIWAIEHQQNGRVIGTISIWNIDLEAKQGELGYGLIPAYQEKGLMKEALLAVLQYGFSIMHLRAIEAYTEVNHTRSRGLLESCHFTLARHVDEPGFASERLYHMAVYRLEASSVLRGMNNGASR